MLNNTGLISIYNSRKVLAGVFTGLILLGCLYVISRFNYLLFHMLAELFSISVAGAVFLLAYNVAGPSRNDSMVFLGISYFYIGMIDLIHTMAYKGMGIFPEELGSNTATQLWIAARAMEAVTMLVYPMLINHRFKAWSFKINIAYAGITAVIMAAVFSWGIFPVCYIDDTGLTVFKKTSEYIICIVLAAAVILLSSRRDDMDKDVFRLLFFSLVVTIAAELAFTFYVDVYGFSNVLGHFFKIISFFLIYAAFVRSSLIRPYSTIFRQLEQEKEALRLSEINLRTSEETIKQQLREKETILKEVHHRIKNNISSVKNLLILQSDSTSNVEAKDIIEKAINRVESMYQIYQKLLLTDDYGELSVKNYIEDLVMSIIDIFPEDGKVTVKMEIDDFTLDVNRLFPLGAIVNELITNSMKYAFAGRESGSIDIVLKRMNNCFTLSIEDDGSGIPDDFDANKSPGFGSMLVKMLAQQINGAVTMENRYGTRSVITFEI